MPQSSLFPVRYGLTVPRGENLQATEILSEGGLDLTQSLIETRPGFASDLTNFEVSLTGGYRRINGFIPYDSNIVPGRSQVLGCSVFTPGYITACRQDSSTPSIYNIYSSQNSGWTKINNIFLNYQAGLIVNSSQHNWNGNYKIIYTDGVNPAYMWDGAGNVTSLNGTGSANNPKFSVEFNGYLFVGGYSSNYGAIKISAPLDETDWQPVNGAAEIVIGDTVTWLAVWRQQLIVFSRNSIHRIIGNSTDTTSATPFTVQPVTDRIGCLEGRTVQEVNGDLIFLANDGLRTISGTFKIGDTEIGSISRPIQSIVSNINPSVTPCTSLVVPRKTQYRLFYPSAGDVEANAPGIIAGIRRFRDGHEDWEFSKLKSIKPSCAAFGYFSTNNDEYCIHGGYDGYVYREEEGDTFNGGAINENYITVPLEFGDRGVRKVLHRVTVYVTIEDGNPQLLLNVIYDLNKPFSVQPSSYQLVNLGLGIGENWDDGSVWDGVGVVWDVAGLPLYRQSVQGSGFVAQLQITCANTAEYSIQGFLVEYFPGGRR